MEAPRQRKSIGAEVNWGVRLETDAEAAALLDKIAGEVAERLQQAGTKGRTVTLKVKRRQSGAPEPVKFLGMGICDNLSRSVTLARFIDQAVEISREAHTLLR